MFLEWPAFDFSVSNIANQTSSSWEYRKTLITKEKDVDQILLVSSTEVFGEECGENACWY